MQIINYSFLITTDQDCEGVRIRTDCSLTPAVIEYPFVLTNDTIALDSDSSWKTDKTLELQVNPFDQHAPSATMTSHGGLWLYLNELYASSALTRWTGVYRWGAYLTRTTVMRYIGNLGSPGGCDMTFSDPTLDIMSDARETAFRIALSGAQENTRQVEVQQA